MRQLGEYQQQLKHIQVIGSERRSSAKTQAGMPVSLILALQRSAGNGAVARELARTTPGVKGPSPMPSLQRCGPVPCNCSAEQRADHATKHDGLSGDDASEEETAAQPGVATQTAPLQRDHSECEEAEADAQQAIGPDTAPQLAPSAGLGKSPSSTQVATIARLVGSEPTSDDAISASDNPATHLSSPRFKGDQVLEACFDDKARLGIGSSGPPVQKVQQALIDLGVSLGTAGADGRYGPATARAVRAFKRQERLGFEQFGDVGPGTMHALDRMFAEDTTDVGGAPSQNDVRTTLSAFGERDVPVGEPFIEAPLAPPQALTVPPNEGDCDPPVAAVVAVNDAVADAGGSGTVGDARGLPPCDVAPAPPGAISDFEEDLRQNPGRISAVVVDPDSQEIIGYRVRSDSTVLQLVDREGNFVAGNEKSLDTPLVDPIDFIPTPAAAAKGAAIVGKIGLKALGKFVAKGGGKEGFKVAAGAIPRLRSVSQAMIARAARAATKKFPAIARNITIEGLNHSFDRHAAQFFGRTVSRETHFQLWRGLVERGVQSTQVFPWTLGANKTVAHLAFIEGKPFVVHFFEESGNLASAFVPSAKQLRSMLALIALAK